MFLAAAVVALVLVVLGGAAAAVLLVRSPSASPGSGRRARGAFPVLCQETMALSNESYEGSAAIVAMRGCRITLTRVTLRGTNPVVATGGAEVTIVGGSIDGRGTSAIQAVDGARVTVSGDAFLEGENTVSAIQGATVTLTSATVRGTRVALAAMVGGTIDAASARNVTVVGEISQLGGRVIR